MSRVGDVDISDTIMVDWLYLPSNTEIVGAEYNWQKRCVTLRIVNPDLPDAHEGDAIPHCDAQYRIDEEGQIEFTGWKLKP